MRGRNRVLDGLGALELHHDGTRTLSTWLTVAAVAARGLGVDLRAIRRVGAPVIATVSLSLLVLLVLSVTVIHGVGIR